MLQNGWPNAGLGQALNDTTRVHPVFTLVAGNTSRAGVAMRTKLTYLNNNPLALFFGQLPPPELAASATPSILTTSLPEFAHLLTAKVRDGGPGAPIMLRLARLDQCETEGSEERLCIPTAATFGSAASLDERSLTMVLPRAKVSRWSWPAPNPTAEIDAGGLAGDSAVDTECVALSPLEIRAFFLHPGV